MTTVGRSDYIIEDGQPTKPSQSDWPDEQHIEHDMRARRGVEHSQGIHEEARKEDYSYSALWKRVEHLAAIVDNMASVLERTLSTMQDDVRANIRLEERVKALEAQIERDE